MPEKNDRFLRNAELTPSEGEEKDIDVPRTEQQLHRRMPLARIGTGMDGEINMSAKRGQFL